MREMVGGCCVCSDDRGWNENPLVYCDGQSCTVAVHQACYGIVTVPTGPWYCRKCESQERSVKVKCELCPSKYGALKRTDNSGWAHVVCALYIPEVRFGNVTTMEPIQLQLIPAERFSKVCYICEEKGKPSSATVGACMNCNRQGCKQAFHVTCAQSLGLLCEEAGNYLDNVKYCGYCQYHSSKLRKSGNVKTIPPYKPVDTQYSDSNSEEVEGKSSGAAGIPASSATSSSSVSSAQQQPTSTSTSTTSGGKRGKTGSSSKTSSSSKTGNSGSGSGSKSSSGGSSSSHQKTVHNSSGGGSNSSSNTTSGGSKGADKLKISNTSSVRSAKSSAVALADDSGAGIEVTDSKTDTRDTKAETLSEQSKDVGKDVKSKKRKTNSRTPTPVESVSVVTPSSSNNSILDLPNTAATDKKSGLPDNFEKPKKAKVETTQSILTNQPVVALTSISTIKSINFSAPSSTTISTPISADLSSLDASTSSTQLSVTHSIIQNHPINSLVVSVPLTSTSLSPHPQIVNNQTSVVTSTPLHIDRSSGPSDRHTPNNTSLIMTGGNSNQGGSIISSEMSGGGLKIIYEKQDAVTTEVDMDLEVSPSTENISPSKRSHSTEKIEKATRSKKRNATANGLISQMNSTVLTTKRSSRSSQQQLQQQQQQQQQQPTTSTPQLGAFSSISQSQIKDSPPSSPSSESQGATSTSGRGRAKTRKSAPASISSGPQSPKESKELKLFQNGVTAPHMLGNQLNPNSNMAQKMSDHLNSELEAHSIFNPNDNSSLVGPQLHHRVISSVRASSTGSSTASGGSGLSSMLGGGLGNVPQTLDQLLERQWEQGSQFLMEQAQHFDIASLLSCLHQLRAENLRLEEHVSSLLQRRDHLLAVNARLAIPLTGQPATPQSSHPHTVNNIHPAVGASHGDVPRPARHGNGGGSNSAYPAHPQGSQHPGSGSGLAIENGLPSDPGQAYSQHSHRSPATSQSQQSPSIRHSPAGSGYPNSGLLRQNADTSGRSAPRPQPYPLYQGSAPSQQQMVIRRDSDVHHQSSSKPS